MPSVLAIESEFERAALLRTIADEQVTGPLTLVDSVDAALAAIDRRVPEVILISPLMPPHEEAQLVARLRALPKTARVQTLITPELAGPPQPKRGWYSRRQVAPSGCDPSDFIKQVNEYLALAKQRQDHDSSTGRGGAERRAARRLEGAAAPAALVGGAPATVVDLSSTGAQIVSPTLLVPGRLVDVVLEDGGAEFRCRAAVVWGSFDTADAAGVKYRAGIDFADGSRLPESFARGRQRPAEETPRELSLVRAEAALPRSRADRLSASDLPWLSSVKLPLGAEAKLLNLSRTGMLVETLSKFAPGSSAPIELRAAENALVVSARFVRSEIVTVDGRGVRYRAAAMFEQEIDLEDLGGSLPPIESTPKDVAEWLRKLANEIQRGRDASALRRRIRDGLTHLVGARDVEIRREPVPPPEDCDSFFFTIADRPSQRSVLQVTFNRGHLPSKMDFKILQAGAALATMLTQFDELDWVA